MPAIDTILDRLEAAVSIAEICLTELKTELARPA